MIVSETHEPHTEPAYEYPARTPSPRAQRTGRYDSGSTEASEAPGSKPEPDARDRLLYLQALYPYGAHDDLMSVIMASPDTKTAAKSAYNVLNPDVYSLPFLKEQRDLSRNENVSALERSGAFAGISELLEDRAGDLMRPGMFENLSQTREYSRTVRTFAIDTSAWDAKFLVPEAGFCAHSQRHFPLTDKEMDRVAATAKAVGAPLAPQSHSPVATRRTKTRIPNSLRRRSAEDGWRQDSFSGADLAAVSPRPSSTSTGAMVQSFEHYVEEPGDEGPVAPIIRWAPKALRVGPTEAQRQQDDMFGIFDGANFFDFPLMSVDTNSRQNPTRGASSNNPRPLPESVFPDRASTTTQPDTHHRTERGDAPATSSSGSPSSSSSSLESVLVSPPTNAARSERSRIHVEVTAPGYQLESKVGHQGAAVPAGEHADGNPLDGPDALAGTHRGSSSTPRTAAKETLEQRKQRRDPPQRLHNRMKHLLPLDVVFRQDETTGEVTGPDPLTVPPRRGPGATRCPDHHGTGAAASSSRDSNNSDGADGVEPSKAEDPFMFLNHEEQRWDSINIVMGSSGIYRANGRCFITAVIKEQCPAFVKECTPFLRAVLLVVSKELAGKQIFGGLSEAPMDLPFFRAKLLTTGPIRIKTLAFKCDKCSIKFDKDDSKCVYIKLRAERVELDPVSFAYISIADADKQNREAQARRRRTDRRRTGDGPQDTYGKGYTNGTAAIKAKDISISAHGSVIMTVSGAWRLNFDKVAVDIGTLSVTTDVGKINFLLTVGKPFIKCTLESLISRVLKTLSSGQ